MQPAVLIRLRALGAWRYGAGEGGKDRLDKMFRSDRLFSAVTHAMRQFGWLEEWLHATARSPVPQVAFTSLFPYQGDALFVSPPRTLWPPTLVTAPSPVFLSKIRWEAAQFVPAALIDSMLTGRPILAEQWIPDPESCCLLRRERSSTTPFRTVTRTRAAVDRLSQTAAHINSFACVEFESGSGLWSVARFADTNAETQWSDRIKAAFRLLADTGFGCGRTIGWGQSAPPEFQNGSWPRLLLPRSTGTGANNRSNGNTAPYWLLSLYSPAETDSPHWSAGDYELVTRGGHQRKNARMIAEGSVVVAAKEPSGAAVNVAAGDHPHPVYRAGFALAVRLPEVIEQDIKPVEEPSDEEAPEAKPCPAPESVESAAAFEPAPEPGPEEPGNAL